MNDEPGAQSLLRGLLASQRFAVLSTHERGQPYGSLVAFTAVDNLRTLLFATERGTRKYRNLVADPRVALVLDNRTNREEDLRDAVAATALGRAEEVDEGEGAHLRDLFLSRHPGLTEFLGEPGCALVAVRVEVYHLVSRFADVAEVRP